MSILRVNGKSIMANQITYVKDGSWVNTEREYEDCVCVGTKYQTVHGVTVHFVGGTELRIADPDADAVRKWLSDEENRELDAAREIPY